MIPSILSLLLSSILSGTPFSGTSHFALPAPSTLEVTRIPSKIQDAPAMPKLSAGSSVAMDVGSHTLLEESNSHQRRPIASITKLMTAAVILGETPLNEVVTVSENAATIEGSQMNLEAGERITVGQLLYGLLIVSGNDAAIALAEHNAGTVAKFVEKMNQKSWELGLSNTHYANPVGLDNDGAYSSAYDVSILAAHLMEDPNIRDIVRLPTAQLTSVDGHVHELKSTNPLLGELGVQGVKTGTTDDAGECFVSYAMSPSNQPVITVILGSKNRFSETKALLNWIYSAYVW